MAVERILCFPTNTIESSSNIAFRIFKKSDKGKRLKDMIKKSKLREEEGTEPIIIKESLLSEWGDVELNAAINWSYIEDNFFTFKVVLIVLYFIEFVQDLNHVISN